jgi:hypothetical protein
MAVRISDSNMLFPAPLVVPGTSRFDQFLTLTSKLHAIADDSPQDTDSKTQLLKCLQLLKTFLATDLHNTICQRLHQPGIVPLPMPVTISWVGS